VTGVTGLVADEPDEDFEPKGERDLLLGPFLGFGITREGFGLPYEFLRPFAIVVVDGEEMVVGGR